MFPSESEIVFLISHFLMSTSSDYQQGDQKVFFTNKTKLVMDLLGESILTPISFTLSETTDSFLLNNYKEVFSLSRFHSSLCTYFNENSPDENPLIYKVLVKIIEA
jgi:hypothetical protein